MPEVLAKPDLLLYDGSFEGFLSAVFEATRSRLGEVRIVARARYRPGLLDAVREVDSWAEYAQRVWLGIEVRGGTELAAMVHGAFLSELEGIETVLWQYLRKLFADPSGAFGRNVLDEHVHAVFAAAQKVQHEAHRFQGLVRFAAASDGSLFAVIAPEHNILERLAPHFCSRFPNEAWMIADSRRGLCLRHQAGEIQLLSCDPSVLPRNAPEVAGLASPEDESFRALWLAYYDAVNIRERANPRLLARLLPRKYWKYLPERAPRMA